LDAIAEWDLVAFAAWPAEEVAASGDWRLRFMKGVSRRGNSVWPGASRDRDDARSREARVEEAERWYAARGLPAMFQLDPTRHPELDALLAARGYEVDAPVSVQIAEARDVARASGAIVSPTLGDAWFDVSARRGRFAGVVDTYHGLLSRIGGRARYALADVGGVPSAVGMGVLDGERMGIFSMLTVPEARRRGGARAVLAGLAAEALSGGAPRLYLLVERDNTPALALYSAASFRELYGYHYRVAPPR
jgi:ribosomal protein S18 acetylase RimI-like enzyme